VSATHPRGDENGLTPKTSAQDFDTKRLETISLADFVDLVEAAGARVPRAEPSAREAESLAIFDRIRD
jgi:hypothetical protein